MRAQKPIKFSSRLHVNRYGVYGFRLVIPKRHKVLFKQSEYRISLKTKNKELAKAHAFRLTALVDRYFKKIHMALNPDDEYKAALELVKSLQLEDFDKHIIFLENLYEDSSDEDKPNVLKLIEIRKKDNELKEEKLRLSKEYVSNLANCHENEIDSVTCDYYAEVTPIKNSEAQLSTELNQLTLDMQALMHQRVSDINLQEAKDEYDSDKEKLAQFASNMVAKASVSSPNAQADTNPNDTKLKQSKTLISDVIKDYSSNQLAEGKWSAKTEDTVNEIFKLWVRIVGDMPIAEYNHEKNREYKAILQKLPPNINKSPKFKNKTIAEILELNEAPAAIHTINKKLAKVSSLFEWAINYGYTTLNPAKGMTIKSPKLARDERQVFSDDDLKKLFSSKVFMKKKYKHPYYFWLPWTSQNSVDIQ